MNQNKREIMNVIQTANLIQLNQNEMDSDLASCLENNA